MNTELKDSVIAFVDILGFKGLIENNETANELFKIIKSIKEQNIEKCFVECTSDTMKALPAITSFSDCIVLSISIEDVKKPFDIGNAVNSLLMSIQPLADCLITGGYILRGGMTRGELYHNDGIVFGRALIDAHNLESTQAKTPRILVSNELAEEYNKSKYDNCNFLSKESLVNGQDEFYLDYLRLSFQNPASRDNYKIKAETTIEILKNEIIEDIKKGNLTQENKLKILKKWINFERHIKKSIQCYQ